MLCNNSTTPGEGVLPLGLATVEDFLLSQVAISGERIDTSEPPSIQRSSKKRQEECQLV